MDAPDWDDVELLGDGMGADIGSQTPSTAPTERPEAVAERKVAGTKFSQEKAHSQSWINRLQCCCGQWLDILRQGEWLLETGCSGIGTPHYGLLVTPKIACIVCKQSRGLGGKSQL